MRIRGERMRKEHKQGRTYLGVNFRAELVFARYELPKVSILGVELRVSVRIGGQERNVRLGAARRRMRREGH